MYHNLDNSEWLIRIPLPSMHGIDTPHKKGEIDFIAKLHAAIEHQLENLSKHSCRLQPPAEFTAILQHYTWENTFKRIERVYKTILSAK